MDNKLDYTKLGYDEFLRRGFNPLPEKTEDDAQAQTPFISQESVSGNIPSEKVQEAVGNIVRITGISELTATGIGNDTGVRLTSDLSDLQDNVRIMFAIPEITAYQGSIASGNEIPYGSNTIGGNYRVHTGFDLADNINASNRSTDNLYPSKNITYIFAIQNESGSTQTLIFRVRWRYLGRETGG